MTLLQNTTERIAGFAVETKYEDLPRDVIQETNRLILDSIGCTIGGTRTEKGRIGILFGEQLFKPGKTTIIGYGKNASPASSAFSNGEAMNALDYESLLSPPEHLTPYVMPACITGCEMNRVSGKELILSIAIAHEITTRLSESLTFGKRFAVEVKEKGLTLGLPTPGYGLCLFGGIAGAGRAIKFTAEEIANAIGIGGYTCPVPMLGKFATTIPTPMSKYLSSGWISQTEIMSLLLTRLGHRGDREILDGEYGFFRYFGSDNWAPEQALKDLGKNWHFANRIFYKTYPCCGAMQNGLGLFQQILDSNNLFTEDIEEVTVVLNPLGALPAWKNRNIDTHVDIQFSTPFLFSLLAHRVKAGPLWQSEGVLKDDAIRKFAQKIKVLTTLDKEAEGHAEITVISSGKRGKKVYRESGFSMAVAMSEERLIDKFRTNANEVIGPEKTQRAVDTILGLEDLEDISLLMDLLVP